MALSQRRPRGVVHHSDGGSQYTSLAFSTRCREAGVVPSMGKAGDCFDNAMAESFFASLECELIDRTPFRDRGHARRELFRYIEGWTVSDGAARLGVAWSKSTLVVTRRAGVSPRLALALVRLGWSDAGH